jgi:hypothetical protein
MIPTSQGHIDMQHGDGQAAWTWKCNMYMDKDNSVDLEHDYGRASWEWSCNMVRDMNTARTCTCSMNKDTLRGHGHAAWTCSMNIRWRYNMDTDMQNRHGCVTWTWTCSRNMDMRHGHRHAAWTITLYLGHVHSARTFPCSMNIDKDIHHRQGHGHVRVHTCRMDMNIDYYWTGALGRNYAKVRNYVYIVFVIMSA